MLDFDSVALVIFGVIGVGLITMLKVAKKKTIEYLITFALLYIYILMVIKYTFFPIMYSDTFRQTFVYRSTQINLIPLLTLTSDGVHESFLNVILFLPFGFLMSIFLKPKYKKVIVWSAVSSLGIELTQFLISYVTSVYFRVSDINDVLFNTVGVIIGVAMYLLFRLVMRRILKNRKVLESRLLKFILS